MSWRRNQHHSILALGYSEKPARRSELDRRQRRFEVSSQLETSAPHFVLKEPAIALANDSVISAAPSVGLLTNHRLRNRTFVSSIASYVVHLAMSRLTSFNSPENAILIAPSIYARLQLPIGPENSSDTLTADI